MPKANPWPARVPFMRQLSERPEGVTATELAEIYDIDRNGIYRVARIHGIKLKRDQVGQPKKRRPVKRQVATENTTNFMIGVFDQYMPAPRGE